MHGAARINKVAQSSAGGHLSVDMAAPLMIQTLDSKAPLGNNVQVRKWLNIPGLES